MKILAFYGLFALPCFDGKSAKARSPLGRLERFTYPDKPGNGFFKMAPDAMSCLFLLLLVSHPSVNWPGIIHVETEQGSKSES